MVSLQLPAREGARSLPRKIQKLEEVVVNRIAAGEVIQRPANALKEMIENCLDAGSASIQVTAKQGGLKLLQIQDNGCGIKKEDMRIVCERFTTSKLRTFEDLSTISTYGFRGEALASISHVAHVAITTRTADSKCAYKASYCDGKIISPRPGIPAEPRPCAGNQGTLIVVEDLFYNVPTRRKALKSPTEEYSKMADVVTKYAVHNAGVGFTLKKHGESVADVRTLSGHTTKDCIGSLYGASVARELLSVACENSKLGFKMQGFVTNANYSVKRLQFLLFINHRLVDSPTIRKATELVYATHLPKNMHPFVYISIDITPANVDVNVHPTKHEVHFLHEDAIVEAIQKAIEEQLLGSGASRTFYTQGLLPGTALPFSLPGSGEEDRRRGAQAGPKLRTQEPREGAVGGATRKSEAPPTYAYQMVRTDSREQKLDAFVRPKSAKEVGTAMEVGAAMEVEPAWAVERSSRGGGEGEGGRDKGKGKSSETGRNPPKKKGSGVSPPLPVSRKARRREAPLTSVQQLQHSVRSKQHKDLTELFRDHTFVGCVDQTRALIQHQTKLYLVDVAKTSQELFYQLALFDFANFGTLKLTPPPPIYDLAMLALDSTESGWTPEDGPKEALSQYIVNLLKSKAEMLMHYFSLGISDDGCVSTLPILLDSHAPNLDRLPHFLLRLATEVDWETEKECFQTFSRECGIFYGVRYDPFLLDTSDPEPGEASASTTDMPDLSTQRSTQEEEASASQGAASLSPPSLYKRQPWRWTMEHVLFTSFRRDWLPQRCMAEDGSILQIADLHELYKVFERC